MLSPLLWKRWKHREYCRLCLHTKKRLPIGAADQATVTKATVLTILCKATNDPARLMSRRLALKNGRCILNCLDAKKALRRPKSPKISTHLTSKKRLSFKWGYFLRFVVSSIKLVCIYPQADIANLLGQLITTLLGDEETRNTIEEATDIYSER